jgi:hypothetical protein
MRDYYDRLEAQLCELTVQGAHRRRRLSVALPRVRVRSGLGDLVALAASAVIVAAVAVVVTVIGVGHNRSHHLPAVANHGPPVLRNIYPARRPAPSGPLVFQSRLAGPSGGKAPAGEVRFTAASPTLTRMVLTAAGLRPVGARDVYAVWLLPAHQFTNSPTSSVGYQVQAGAPPQLLGVIEPSAGSSGHLTIVSVLSDATVGGVYKLEITVQPRSSTTAPGSVVLQRFVDF